MTREDAIEILIAVAVCDRPILSCDFCARYAGIGTHCNHPTDEEIEEAVLLLKGASKDMAISSLRQQDHFREVTKKVEPMTLDDAIAHLDDTLSDTGRKWSCESCRMEHVQLREWLAELREIKQERNAPLTMAELWQIYEANEPVYLYIFGSDFSSGWEIIEQITDKKIIFRGSIGVYVPIKELGISYNFYRQKPKECTI